MSRVNFSVPANSQKLSYEKLKKVSKRNYQYSNFKKYGFYKLKASGFIYLADKIIDNSIIELCRVMQII